MRLFLLLWTLAFAVPVHAQVRPSPGEGDPRLQTIMFDAKQVVQLSVATGFQLMIAFAPGEVVETVALGDSAAWQVSPGKRGDFIFLKNVQASATTNMTVVTDARAYSFELTPSGGYANDAPYIVKFLYDPQPVAAVEPIEDEEVTFLVRGAKAIRPIRVYQIGNRTFAEWLPNQLLPAVFAVENRIESVVNGEMQDGRFIIVGTPSKLLFRMDQQIATATRKGKARP
jgi:type IV secretion system protein VirB9